MEIIVTAFAAIAAASCFVAILSRDRKESERDDEAAEQNTSAE